MNGITLQRRLIGTDCGDLWLGATGGAAVSLIRLLDREKADIEFRHQVEDVAASLVRNPLPRVLPIVDHQFHGDHYYIQYGLGGRRTQSVLEFFTRAHWLKRLRFVESVSSVYDDWKTRIPLPLGPHGGRLVACKLGGRWVAHLAACPPLQLRSPMDLLHADREVLAAVAPEVLRGIGSLGVTEDVYSASVLVLQALGIRDFDALTNPEALIEDHARAHFSTWDLRTGDAEPPLWQIPAARDLFASLEVAVRHGSVYSPHGRPPGLRNLHDSLAHVLALEDSACLAADLKSQGRLGEALQVLEWYLQGPLHALVDEGRIPSEGRRIHRLAAELCAELKMPARELRHIEKVLENNAGETALERRRLQLRYEAYFQKKPYAHGAGPDVETDWLIAEIDRLRQRLPEGDPTVKEDRLRSAMIRWRRGDLYGRAAELYELTKLDESDLDALYLYALAYCDLCQPGLVEKEREARAAGLGKLVREGERRLRKMNEAGLIDDDEMNTWNERFQSLPRC